MSSPRDGPETTCVTLCPNTWCSGGLGGWPLPTMADGDALHATRTKVLSVVEIQKVLRSRLFYQLFSALFTLTDKHKRLEAFLEDFQPLQTQAIT
jgi:hypothetical protein